MSDHTYTEIQTLTSCPTCRASLTKIDAGGGITARCRNGHVFNATAPVPTPPDFGGDTAATVAAIIL